MTTTTPEYEAMMSATTLAELAEKAYAAVARLFEALDSAEQQGRAAVPMSGEAHAMLILALEMRDVLATSARDAIWTMQLAEAEAVDD
jgi:hypothetical protein